MSQEDFLEFSAVLKGPLVLKKKDTDGNLFKWHDTQLFQYSAEDFGAIQFKKSLQSSEEFGTLSLQKIKYIFDQ